MAIFCTIYYVFSYIQTIPQVIKLLKTKSSNDYSLVMLLLQLIALISWSLYIFTSKQSIIVYIGTIIDLVLLFFIDFLILKYYKFNKNNIVIN
jgi:MtN3 and saliva related transmembrane protein